VEYTVRFTARPANGHGKLQTGTWL